MIMNQLFHFLQMWLEKKKVNSTLNLLFALFQLLG